MAPRSARRQGLVASGLTAAFVLLALRVAGGDEVPGDQALLEAVRSGMPARLDGAVRAVDRGTGSAVVAVTAALLAGALLLARRVRDATVVVVAVGGAVLVNPLLKRAVDRPRPGVLPSLADASPLSFPSGHAAATAALATCAVLLAAGGGWCRSVVAAASLLVVAAGAAQLVLARHHPSDLLGGWLWATAWALAVALVVRPEADPPSIR